MNDKLRAAAKAAYKAMIAAELSDGSKREWDAAVDGLKASLAEQAVKDSLTVQRPWVGLTDDERDSITDKVIGFNSCCGWEDDYAKAIETKLKEKNIEHI